MIVSWTAYPSQREMILNLDNLQNQNSELDAERKA